MARAALDEKKALERWYVAAEKVAQVTIVAELKYLDNSCKMSASLGVYLLRPAANCRFFRWHEFPRKFAVRSKQ
jgi:hypothetical protein